MSGTFNKPANSLFFTTLADYSKAKIVHVDEEIMKCLERCEHV